MSRFPTAGHLAAWAGVAPASHESAGKRRPAGTRHGSRHLREALIEAARAAARTKGTFLAARYQPHRPPPRPQQGGRRHRPLHPRRRLPHAATGEVYNDLGAALLRQAHRPRPPRSDATSPNSKPPATPSPSPPPPDTRNHHPRGSRPDPAAPTPPTRPDSFHPRMDSRPSGGKVPSPPGHGVS